MRLLTFLLSIVVLFALADASVAQVRYSVAELPKAAPATARSVGLRTLSWPGKTAIAQPAAPQPAYAPVAPRPMTRSLPAPVAPQVPAMTYGPPPPYPVAPPLPTSIYAPPPPAAASIAPIPPTPPAPPAAPKVKALAMASRMDPDAPASPRLYSVHRQYGETPDPIPLTPQFFESSSQDLAAPPPPVARPQTTATGRVVRSLPSDPDSGGPQGQ